MKKKMAFWKKIKVIEGEDNVCRTFADKSK